MESNLQNIIITKETQKRLIRDIADLIKYPLTNHKIRNRVQFVTITNPVTKVPKNVV